MSSMLSNEAGENDEWKEMVEERKVERSFDVEYAGREKKEDIKEQSLDTGMIWWPGNSVPEE